MALNLILSGEILYRRTPDLGLLRCVDVVEAVKHTEQIHAGVCGTHMNWLTSARKILRAGYFWLTMENDCCKFVKTCHKCQVHGDLIRVPPHELNALTFVAWASDKSITKKVVADFVRDNLLCRSYRPQMKQDVESANKNIKKIMRKMDDNHRGCREMFPYDSLDYRTTIRTSTGATPYLLVYGTEAPTTTEVEIQSLRIIQETELSNAEWVRKRIQQLTLIDEKRMVVVCHGLLYR
nr:uncharacterized protein LOC101252049 [Solanum lycopersicum]